ncbi:MAG: dephospho-CoA kinase, partial [Synergistetes bacterium]|nr:dephospho-CoA kinase [Synergistota bacterium]
KERGWSEEELKRRERFFMDEEKKIQLADIVIDNDGSIEDLWEKVKKAWNFITSLRDTSRSMK